MPNFTIKGITVDEFKKYFNRQYAHIYHNKSDKEIYEFLKRINFKGQSIIVAADLFSDMLLSSGDCDVVE